MEFLNPAMFWGVLAISIPLLIHLWHQKQGKVLPWAATRWLNEKDIQQSRSLKLDNLLLLLLRIAILLLMVLLFARPQLKKAFFSSEKVHWIEPSEAVLSNFKFELDEAQKKGKKLFWLNGETVGNLNPFENKTDIQEGINKITEQLNGNEKAELYISSSAQITEKPQIFISNEFNLNISPNHASKSKPNYITLAENKKLFINEEERLVSENHSFDYTPVLDRSFQVFLPQPNSAIKAALLALEEVYNLNFEIDSLAKNNKLYDLTIADSLVSNAEINIIYGADSIPFSQKKWTKNIYCINQDINNSDLVFDAILPEKILEVIISHYKLNNIDKKLTDKQIKTKFTKRVNSMNTYDSKLTSIVFLVLIVIIGVERWLSISKNI